jgi:hypothetical protein
MRKETKIIKDFLKANGLPQIKVRYHKGEMCADMEKGIIYIDGVWLSFKSDDESEFLMYSYQHYRKLKYDIKISMRVFAIFHEIGHILSMKQYKNYGVAHYHYTIGIDKILVRKMPTDTTFYHYRKLKMERLADQYGYEFYKKVESQAIELDKQLTELVR